MNGVFINYRRDDTAPYAGRIYDHLRHAFPQNKVFMDIDTIDPGEDFLDAVEQTLAASKIVVAVIGPSWERIADAQGNRRLDNPDDYVVRELTAALESKARVIPVLVGGAAMPRTEALPSSLQALARKNAIEISDTRFIADAERLKSVIARVIEVETNVERPTEGRAHLAESPDLADALTTFKTLLWTGYALGLVELFVLLGKAREEGLVVPMLIVGVLLLGFEAWFNVMLVRGRNWARMGFIALGALTFPGGFLELQEQSPSQIALMVVSLLLTLWLIRLMFTEPLRRLFVRRT